MVNKLKQLKYVDPSKLELPEYHVAHMDLIAYVRTSIGQGKLGSKFNNIIEFCNTDEKAQESIELVSQHTGRSRSQVIKIAAESLMCNAPGIVLVDPINTKHVSKTCKHKVCEHGYCLIRATLDRLRYTNRLIAITAVTTEEDADTLAEYIRGKLAENNLIEFVVITGKHCSGPHHVSIRMREDKTGVVTYPLFDGDFITGDMLEEQGRRNQRIRKIFQGLFREIPELLYTAPQPPHGTQLRFSPEQYGGPASLTYTLYNLSDMKNKRKKGTVDMADLYAGRPFGKKTPRERGESHRHYIDYNEKNDNKREAILKPYARALSDDTVKITAPILNFGSLEETRRALHIQAAKMAVKDENGNPVSLFLIKDKTPEAFEELTQAVGLNVEGKINDLEGSFYTTTMTREAFEEKVESLTITGKEKYQYDLWVSGQAQRNYEKVVQENESDIVKSNGLLNNITQMLSTLAELIIWTAKQTLDRLYSVYLKVKGKIEAAKIIMSRQDLARLTSTC